MIFHGASMSALGLRRDKAALSSGCKSHPSMQRYHLNQGYLRSGQPRVSHPIGPTIPHRNAEPAMLALLPAVSPRIFPRRSGLLISLSKTAPPKWGRIVLAVHTSNSAPYVPSPRTSTGEVYGPNGGALANGQTNRGCVREGDRVRARVWSFLKLET